MEVLIVPFHAVAGLECGLNGVVSAVQCGAYDLGHAGVEDEILVRLDADDARDEDAGFGDEGAAGLEEIDDVLARGDEKNAHLIVTDFIVLNFHRTFHAGETDSDMVLGDLAVAYRQLSSAKTDPLMIVAEEAITDCGGGKMDLQSGKGIMKLAILKNIFFAGGEDQEIGPVLRGWSCLSGLKDDGVFRSSLGLNPAQDTNFGVADTIMV